MSLVSAIVIVLVVLGVVAGGAQVARADRDVAVTVDAGAPFGGDELAAALRVRLGAGPAVRVHVRVVDGGGLVVEAGDRAQAVALDGREGADAARLVALVVVDLVQDDLAIAPSPPPEATPAMTTPVIAPAPAALTVRAAPAAAPTPIEVAVLGTASQWDGVLASASVDVAVPRGRWLGALEIGGGALVGGALVGGGAGLSGMIVRAGGGARAGWIDLRAGLVLAPIEVVDGTGDRTVLVGAGASARLRVPLAERVRLVIAAGADAFATRDEYRLGDTMLTATPWVAPWLAAGVEVTP